MLRPTHLAVAGGLVVVLAAPTGAGLAAYRHDVSHRALLPPGTRIAGIDVSWLDRAAAVETVSARFAAEATRPVTVRAGGQDFSVTRRDLGIEHDAAVAVDRAFEVARRGSWVSRTWKRLNHRSIGPAVSLASGTPDRAALERFVASVVDGASLPPRNAGVRAVEGFLRFERARAGRQVSPAAVRAAVLAALKDGQQHEVATKPLAPTVADSAVRTAILVRTGENKLYLYRDGVVVRTFGVATGSWRYPTPTGSFAVTLKRYRPTWVNPWSSWSMNEPAFIGPGPRNPLGTRALNLSAPGIRIHGTPKPSSIGYSVSHGCIRMRMPDVEELYDLVDVGTPVVIVRAGPPRVSGPAPSGTSPADAADGG